MADPRHLEIARRGAQMWNTWREGDMSGGADMDDPPDPEEPADFSGHDFRKDPIDFSGFRFGRKANFDATTFGDWASFDAATFGDFARFGAGTGTDWSAFAARRVEALNERIGQVRAEAWREAWTRGGARNGFRTITFSRTRFGRRADFAGRRLTGTLDLSRSRFAGPPDLSGLENPERLDPTGLRVTVGNQGGWRRNWTTDSGTVTAVRRLRKLAAEIHHHDWERDLFVLERQAERGELWATFWRAWKAPDDFTYLETGRLFWQALTQTLLVALYGLSSDFGRSLVRPLAWLGLLQLPFYDWYGAAAENRASGRKSITSPPTSPWPRPSRSCPAPKRRRRPISGPCRTTFSPSPCNWARWRTACCRPCSCSWRCSPCGISSR